MSVVNIQNSGPVPLWASANLRILSRCLWEFRTEDCCENQKSKMQIFWGPRKFADTNAGTVTKTSVERWRTGDRDKQCMTRNFVAAQTHIEAGKWFQKLQLTRAQQSQDSIPKSRSFYYEWPPPPINRFSVPVACFALPSSRRRRRLHEGKGSAARSCAHAATTPVATSHRYAASGEATAISRTWNVYMRCI